MFVISNENAKIQIISDIYNIFITKKGKEYPKPDAKQRCRESGQWAKMKKQGFYADLSCHNSHD